MSGEPKEIIENINITRNILHSTYQEFSSTSSSHLSNLSILIEMLKQRSQSNINTIDNSIINDVRSFVQPMAESVQETTRKHKEVFNVINKCLKNNKKIFPDDIHKISTGIFDADPPRKILHQLLIKHFLMYGKADLARILSREMCIDFDDSLLYKYSQVNKISKDLLNQDFSSLNNWLQENSATVEKVGSKLNFILIKLNLTELLFQGRIQDFMARCRKEFQTNIVKDELCAHVKKLMPILINTKSGCHDHIIHEIWDDLNSELFMTANLILQGGSESPLLSILQVGLRSMEPLLNFARQYESARVIKYEGSSLPVDLKLHSSFQHHSMYICPVLKEPCTLENPPMRMKCGHLISRNGMLSILVNDRHSIKCPYCPILSKKTDMIGIRL